MLELYHFEPAANSMKPLICLSEKGVDFVSRQLNLEGRRDLSPGTSPSTAPSGGPPDSAAG